MKKVLFILGLISLMAAACKTVVLKQEIPSSPKESYNQLPK